MILPPAAVTVARLDRTSGWRRFAVAPDGPGWVRLDERVAAGPAMDAWVQAEQQATAGGHADLAGALIVYRVSGHLAELAVGCLLDQRRALPLTPAAVALRFGPAARLEQMAVTPASVWVLADDPVARGPSDDGRAARAADVSETGGRSDDASVHGDAGGRPAGVDVAPSVTELRAIAADGLVAVFAPLVEAVRARAPFGRRGMWGTLADHVAEVAVRRARERGRDVEAALDDADLLIDAIAARSPALRTRPRRQVVETRRGPATAVTKGTCCLIYKAGARPTERGDAARLVGSAACTSCPLRGESDRARRYASYLDTLPS